MIGPDPLNHAWWLASRASGLVALGLLTIAVIAGLVLGGRLTRSRPGAARAVKVLHEHAALAGLVAIGVHGATLLGDAFLRPGLSGLFIPGAIGYRPLPVASGIVAAYVAAALGLSYPLRRRIGIKRWRTAHRFTVVAYALAVVHTLTAGTDAGLAWVFWPTLAGAGVTAVLLVRRMAGPRLGLPKNVAQKGAAVTAPDAATGSRPREVAAAGR